MPIPAQSATKKNHGLWVWWGQGFERATSHFRWCPVQLEEAALTALSLDLEPTETWVHGDVAYQIGQYDETVQFEGQEQVDVANYFFCRWEKQADGTWKLDRFLSGPRDAPPKG